MKSLPLASPTANAFLTALSVRLGLGFSMDRYAVMERAIHEKIRSGRFQSANAFLAALGRDQKLLHELIETVVVPETHFFRHPQHFAFVRDHVLPEIAGTGRPIRLWSAGCSTGEEPYSLAILLHQMGLSSRVEIYATDVCRPALERARKGIYRRWSLRGVEEWPGASCYFERVATGEYRLARRICDLVSFRELNLADPLLPASGNGLAQIDIIFCRNVLIYMTAKATVDIVRRLIEMLAPGGWLIPGPSDPLAGHRVLSHPFITPHGIFYRRADGELAAKAATKSPPAGHLSPAPRAAQQDLRPIHRDSSKRHAKERIANDGLPRTPASIELSDNVVAARPATRKAGSESLPASVSQAEQSFAQKVGLLVNAGRSEEAWHVVNRAVEREPLSTEAHYLAAFVHWHRMSLDDALACLGKAIYLDPECAAAHQMRGLLLVQKGQVERARRAFQTAHQLATRLPDDAAIDFGEGETAAQLARAAQSQIRSLQDSGGTR